MGRKILYGSLLGLGIIAIVCGLLLNQIKKPKVNIPAEQPAIALYRTNTFTAKQIDYLNIYPDGYVLYYRESQTGLDTQKIWNTANLTQQEFNGLIHTINSWAKELQSLPADTNNGSTEEILVVHYQDLNFSCKVSWSDKMPDNMPPVIYKAISNELNAIARITTEVAREVN